MFQLSKGKVLINTKHAAQSFPRKKYLFIDWV